jgi:hypothetical protein
MEINSNITPEEAGKLLARFKLIEKGPQMTLKELKDLHAYLVMIVPVMRYVPSYSLMRTDIYQEIERLESIFLHWGKD